ESAQRDRESVLLRGIGSTPPGGRIRLSQHVEGHTIACYFYNTYARLITHMPTAGDRALTRRERQIMDILYRRGRATAAEVMSELSGDPTYSTVRTQLRVLEEKGQVR